MGDWLVQAPAGEWPAKLRARFARAPSVRRALLFRSLAGPWGLGNNTGDGLMIPIKKLFTSSLGKKYLMSLTGLALVGFLVAHLAGNLQLLLPSGVWFNKYAHHLESMGPLLVVAEIGLLAIVAVHIVVAIIINLGVNEARPTGYYGGEKSKGGDSRMNLSSRHMLILGVGILIFIVMHVWQFKYGAYYHTQIDGKDHRDLYLLVRETFRNPVWVLVYTVFMGFVGFHLRHGIWSMFQSLGAMPKALSAPIYVLGAVCAVALALGFVLLPVWLYLGIPELLAKMTGAQ